MTAGASGSPAVPPHGWGRQTSFVQRHEAAFWLFVAILAVTGLDFLARQLEMLQATPGAWLLTVLLLVPYAVPVIALVYYLDLYEREPVSILVAALLWGGIAATTLALYTTTPLLEVVFKLTGDAGFTGAWGAALTAPFVEELFKGLAVVLLVAIARNELDDVLDGFVWGAMVGIGFLLVEDVFYFVRAAADTGSLAAVLQMFLIRVVGAGPYSHFLYTGLVGMGIAFAIVRVDLPSAVRLAAGGALIAAGVAAHAFWNSPVLVGLIGDGESAAGWALYLTAKGLPMLIGLAVLVRLARQREGRAFAVLAAGFHDGGSITPTELEELSGLRARWRARRAVGRSKGPRGRKLQGRLQREQLGLALAFCHHGTAAHPEVARRMAEIAATREKLAALPVLAGTRAT